MSVRLKFALLVSLYVALCAVSRDALAQVSTVQEFQVFSNDELQSEEAPVCGTEGVEVDNKCFATEPKLVLQNALLEDFLSTDGSEFERVNVFKYVVTFFNVPIIAASSANGSTASDVVEFQRKHMQPRFDEEVIVSLATNGDGSECTNRTVEESVWFHNETKGHMEQVKLVPACAGSGLENSSTNAVGFLRLRTNRLGQVSFHIPSNGRLLGLPLVNLRAGFMLDDAVYEVNPDASVWAALASMPVTSLEISAKSNGDPFVQQIARAAQNLLAIANYDLGLANQPLSVRGLVNGPRRLNRRSHLARQHSVHQLPGIANVYNPGNGVVFGRLSFSKNAKLEKRELTSADTYSAVISQAYRRAKQTLKHALAALKSSFQRLYRSAFYIFDWKPITLAATALSNHAVGMLDEIASVPEDKTQPLLERIDTVRDEKMGMIKNAAAKFGGAESGSSESPIVKDKSQALSDSVKGIHEGYLNNLVATYWGNSSLGELDASADSQLQAMRDELSRVMDKTVRDPQLKRNRSLIAAQQELSGELNHAIAQRKFSKILSQKVKAIGKAAVAGAIRTAGAVWDLSFRVIRLVVQVGLAVTSATVKFVKALLATRINIPFVTKFVEKVILGGAPGAQFNLLSMFALLGAVPYTVVYRASYGGKVPFDEKFLTRQNELIQNGKLLDLISGEPTSIADMGGMAVMLSYGGFTKVALAGIDSIMMFIPLPRMVSNVYWLYFDLLNTPTIPMAVEGPAHGISEAAYTLYTYSLISDLYFLYSDRIGSVIAPKAWIGKQLGGPSHLKAVAWARDTMWFTIRSYATFGMLVWLFAEVYNTYAQTITDSKVYKYAMAALVLDIQSAFFGIFPMVLQARPPAADTKVPAWVFLYPVNNIMGYGRSAFSQLFRGISNAIKFASGLVTFKAAALASGTAKKNQPEEEDITPVHPVTVDPVSHRGVAVKASH